MLSLLSTVLGTTVIVPGLLLSNAAFVFAACCLCAATLARPARGHRSERAACAGGRRYELGVEVLRERQLARSAALLFCLSPASAFFSSLYSESCYALVTFAALLLLERRRP